MSQRGITATVLNPDDPNGPWAIELVLTDHDGSIVTRTGFAHHGDDYNTQAGPALDRVRREAQARGWTDPAPTPTEGA